MNLLTRIVMILFLPLSCFSQVQFVRGYFIDNSNARVECFIEDRGWKNSPSDFMYKLDENGAVKKANVSDVREFGIESRSRYIAANVNIDRTGDNIDNTTAERRPVWNKEQLFLAVLIEGKISLLSYEDGNFQRFFYQTKDTIKQLINKKFTMQSGGYGVNDAFRQQLRAEVLCGEITDDELKRVDYTMKELVTFFTNYNKCSGSTFTDYTQMASNKRKSSVRFRFTPGMNVTSLKIMDSYNGEDIDFGKKAGFRMGAEIELVLPYNRNKWAIVFEPSFQSFKSTVSDGMSAKVSMFEIPVGLRHYFFLNEQSRLFINGLLVLPMSGESAITVYNVSYEVTATPSLAIGGGYSIGRFSGEARFYRNKDILNDHLYLEATYSRWSFILGYRM
jgi:hypothetical protein